MASKAELTALFKDETYHKEILVKFPEDGLSRIQYMRDNEPKDIINVFGILPIAQFKKDGNPGKGEYLYFVPTFTDACQQAFVFSQVVVSTFKEVWGEK